MPGLGLRARGERLDVDPVEDDDGPCLHADGAAGGLLVVAHADHDVGPAAGEDLPGGGQPGQRAADGLEAPGVRHEDGGPAAAEGEPPGEAGLGRVEDDDVGVDGVDDAGQAAGLGEHARAGERVAAHGWTVAPSSAASTARPGPGGQATWTSWPRATWSAAMDATTRGTPASTGWLTCSSRRGTPHRLFSPLWLTDPSQREREGGELSSLERVNGGPPPHSGETARSAISPRVRDEIGDLAQIGRAGQRPLAKRTSEKVRRMILMSSQSDQFSM